MSHDSTNSNVFRLFKNSPSDIAKLLEKMHSLLPLPTDKNSSVILTQNTNLKCLNEQQQVISTTTKGLSTLGLFARNTRMATTPAPRPKHSAPGKT